MAESTVISLRNVDVFQQKHLVLSSVNLDSTDVPVGVYYYLIKLSPKDKPLSGSLTLIR